MPSWFFSVPLQGHWADSPGYFAFYCFLLFFTNFYLHKLRQITWTRQTGNTSFFLLANSWHWLVNMAVSLDVTADCVTVSQPPCLTGDMSGCSCRRHLTCSLNKRFNLKNLSKLFSVVKSCDTGLVVLVFFGNDKIQIWCYCT